VENSLLSCELQQQNKELEEIIRSLSVELNQALQRSVSKLKINDSTVAR
jgi:hypothetical protein